MNNDRLSTVATRYWLFGLLAFLPLLVILAYWPRLFPLDDTYITLHNARSLIAGSDSLFGVNPLVGATSAVHVACVSLLGLLVPLPDAALTVSAVCTLLYAWGLWRLYPHWAFVLIGLLASYVPIHLLNGLETSMAMAAVVWAFVLADNRCLPLLLGLMPFIRPDLLFLAGPLALRQMRDAPARVIAFGLLAAVPFALWTYVATGSPFPSTAEAKVIFFAQHHNPLAQKALSVPFTLATSLLVALLAGVVGLFKLRAGWCGIVYIVAVLGGAALMLPGALRFNDYRYLAPMVPVFCYGLTILPRKAIVVLAVVSLVTGANALVRLYNEHTVEMKKWFDGADAVSRLPSGSTVLVHDVGIVAWKNPSVRLVDVVGLKTPSSISAMKRHNVRGCRWGAALNEIALRSGAQYVVVLEEPFWNCVGKNLQQQGWTLTAIYTGGFAIYQLRPPEERT